MRAVHQQQTSWGGQRKIFHICLLISTRTGSLEYGCVWSNVQVGDGVGCWVCMWGVLCAHSMCTGKVNQCGSLFVWEWQCMCVSACVCRGWLPRLTFLSGLTCSFVVRPLATSTIWKPVSPTTGMKNSPDMHMTTRLKGTASQGDSTLPAHATDTRFYIHAQG